MCTMTDLAKNLLSQYYGLDAESNDKRFLSIHQSVDDIKRDEEKQVTKQISSTTNEENVSEEESQKDIDEYRKFSIADDRYSHSSEIFDDLEDTYDLNKDLDDFDIDFGPNIMCDFTETRSSTAHDQSSNAIKETVEDSEINDSKNTNENDMSLTFVEDGFPDSASDASSATLKKSQKSSKISTNIPVVSKKEPTCNETFADYSSIELKQFPSEILNKFPYIRMLYLADNYLTELPDDIFTFLRCLEWLDVRNNQISSLPATIKSHTCLETILLQKNKIENLPLELCTLPKLKTLQVAQNPLITPPQDIVASGCPAILEFLRIEWNNAHPEERVAFKENKIEPKLSTILCYQSPRRNKKKILPLKSAVRNRNPSTAEKRKSYKPSNRYNGKTFSINNSTLGESSKLINSINKNLKYTHERTKRSLQSSKSLKNKIGIPMKDEIEEVSAKVLRLMGPSPRSLYVRNNIKILKTYQNPVRKECRNIDRFDIIDSVKTENKFSCRENENYKKCKNNVGDIDCVFDIITRDGKRFKLNSMRLNDSDWMLSCLENYVGINKCENKGANIPLEYRLLWFSKLKELFAKQTSILQKVKDENVLKQWRRDRRSFSRSMEKAVKRNEDDIPFGFDVRDYANIFKHNFKSDNRGSKKQKFVPPADINKKMNELLKSLNELEVKDTDTTPRTRQNLFKNEIEKILQFQNEIQNLRKYNDVATVSLKN